MHKNLISFLVFIFFGIIYYLGSFDKIPFADSADIVTDYMHANFDWKVLSTNHFLFLNTCVIFQKFVSPIYAPEIGKFVNIISAALTMSILYRCFFDFVKTSWVAIVSCIIFGLSFSFWKISEILEVYAFNTIWIALYFLFVTKYLNNRGLKDLVLAGLFLGLGQLSHIQNFLLIPSFIVLIAITKSSLKVTSVALTAFSIPISLMILINIIADVPLSNIFLSDRGTWIADTFHKSFFEYFQNFLKSILYLIYNFNIFVIIGIMGIIRIYKDNKSFFWVFSTAGFLIYSFATFYEVSDNYVYFIGFYIIFTMAIGYEILYLSKKHRIKAIVFVLAAITPLYYFGTYKIADSIKYTQSFKNHKEYKGGLKYYLLPWMNNNVGIIGFVIDKKSAPEKITWMQGSAEQIIEYLKEQGFTEEEIKKL